MNCKLFYFVHPSHRQFFSLLEKLVIVVIFAKLIGLKNNVGIYTLDSMRVFWANVNILQTVVFFLSSHTGNLQSV